MELLMLSIMCIAAIAAVLFLTWWITSAETLIYGEKEKKKKKSK